MRNSRCSLVLISLSVLLTGVALGAPARRSGEVSLSGRAVRDADGEFVGLGTSYFQALRRVKFDRDRFRQDLKFVSDHGFDYIRTLSMVGWNDAWREREIAPVSFTNRIGNPIKGWQDYSQQLTEMIDIAYDEFGLRTQLTIFADGQLMPGRNQRRAHLDRVLQIIQGREEKVILLEVANEGWQNGFSGAEGIRELREYGKYIADRTPVLVALSATEHTTNEALAELYIGSAADIATEHFSRDLRSREGGWLPVRDPFRVNLIKDLMPVCSNEPIGPGASVAGQSEPIMLASAAAYAWMSGLAMYVHHTAAGTLGDERFEAMPGFADFRNLRRMLPCDIANWRHSEGLDDFAPFITFAGGQRNKSWLEVNGAEDGALRLLTCVRDDRFYSLPIGIQSVGVTLEAKRAMSIDVLNVLTAEIVMHKSMGVGEKLNLPQGSGAYLIRGQLRQ